MRGLLLVLLFPLFWATSLCGQNSHLLIYSQGDGALYRTDNGNNDPLVKASFLPISKRISVRPRSGIETLAAGYQFRFGAGTVFSLGRSEVSIEQGSILVNSRRLSNQVSLLSPESKMTVGGVGCALVNVEPNGGLKAVGLLGKTVLRDVQGGGEFFLLPGQLVFLMPGKRGFGQEVSVNLAKLIESSYLVSGFPNSTTFLGSLRTITDAQSEMVGKTYGAVVGNAKQAESFEVVPTAPQTNSNPSSSKDPSTNSFTDNEDPLAELLGRPRSKGNKVKSSPVNRPFPSKLLRGAN